VTTVAPAGRRDRKKSATREALRAAALRLVAEHGYENVTVEMITEAVDVSARTFFNYFTSKDDALLSTDPDLTGDIARALLARPLQEPPLAALRTVLVQLADRFTAKEATWRERLAVVRANPQLWPRLVAGFTGFERTLTETVARRTGTDPDTDLYPGLVAAAAVGALRVALAQWRTGGAGSDGPDRADLHRLLGQAFDTLAAGFPPPGPTHGAA
jgi:AcrR family transcriptional regulator